MNYKVFLSGICLIVSLLWPLSPTLAQSAQTASAAKTIDALNTRELSPGKHQFYLDAGTRPGGSPLLVPIIVLKGDSPGPRLLLTAAIHGDELNGIAVIHDLVAHLKGKALSGTLIMIPGLNQIGIERHSRFFHGADNGGQTADLNRLMPGAAQTRSAAMQFATKVWTDLLFPNADMVIDLHTQSRGTSYPLFVFADFRNKIAREMAIQLMPDVIKDDHGEKGTLETSFITSGVPAVTFEIGAPKIFQAEMIARAVRGIENIMIRQNMIKGKPHKPLHKPVMGTEVANIAVIRGGIARIHVSLMQHIEAGQRLATVYDPFGNVLDHYHAPFAGIVLAVATDPIREPASLLVRILR